MNKEEFFNRLINKIDKEFGYDVANTLQLMFIKKEKQVEQLEKEIDRLNKEYERIYNENCKLRENHNINDITLLDENDRLNNIINYIWQVFENGSFEDGCDCIKIYDYLKALKEK